MKIKFSKNQLQNYIIFLSKIINCSNESIVKFDLVEKSISTTTHDALRTWIRLISMKKTSDDDLFDIVENDQNIDSFCIFLPSIKNYIDTIRVLQSFEKTESISIDFHGYENFKTIDLLELQKNKKDNNKIDLTTKISDREVLFTNSTKIIFNHIDIKNIVDMLFPHVNENVQNRYNNMFDADSLRYSLKINNISNICNLLKKQKTNFLDTAYITLTLDENTDKLTFKTSDSIVEYSIPLNEIIETKNSDGNNVYNYSFKPVDNLISAIDSANSIIIKLNEKNVVNFEETVENISINNFIGCSKN